MKLALIQMRVEPGQVDHNISHATELIVQAASQGAQVLLLPEALPFGWMDPSARESAEEIPEGKYFRAFAELAARHRIYLCTGLVEASAGKIFNSAVFISPEGNLLLHHRKIHELGIAHDSYALGDRLGVIGTEFGKIGLMICADGFVPGQAISRTLSLMGAQLILSPCAWAVPPAHENETDPYGKLWLDNYGAVTREFGSWTAGCSNVGTITSGPWKGHKCIGCSLLVGPDGRAHAQGKYGENAEQIVLVEITLCPVARSSGE